MRDSEIAHYDKWIYDKVLPFINDANKTRSVGTGNMTI